MAMAMMARTQADVADSEYANTEELLDVAALVRMFEESEESTFEARQLAERDRDYYDHKQLTAEEQETLRKRGQPEVIANRIAPKVNFLVGLEKSQRVNPRAMPRTPAHEQDADAASQALTYVADDQDFDDKRSEVWRNMLCEGAGGIMVTVEPSYRDELCVKLEHVAWDRMFWDPHSSRPDFSDATYKGLVVWMDYDDALAKYPGSEEILDATLSTAPTETYDDKPKFSMWADKKRKRVRICQIWIYRQDQWFFAEYTKGGILVAGPSPFVDDQGESDCALIFQSAYVDRDNARYGMVRVMVSLQDEVNKRRSKALHLLNTAQIITKQGALTGLQGLEDIRREAARPDGVFLLPDGPDPINNSLQVNTRSDLATGQVTLLQETKNELDQLGPNATMMGEKAMGSSSASGKAIIASQQGGMMEIGDLMDKLRHFDKQVFRAIWNRIRQFWTAEKWLRVTDDERNIKWVAMNIDPMRLQMIAMQNPQLAQNIIGSIGNVAELDCDIIIDESPDSVTPALEQWQGLVELAKSGIAIPPDVLIRAAPNLRDKDKLLQRMKEVQEQAGPPPELQIKQAELGMEQQRHQFEMQSKAVDLQMEQNRAQADGIKIMADIRRLEFEAQKLEEDMAIRRGELMLKKQAQDDTAAKVQSEMALKQAQIDEIYAKISQLGADMEADKADREAKATEKKEVDSAQHQELAQAMLRLAEQMARPKKVIRDASGLVAAVQ